jgi:putative restriction endonuclease
MRLFVGVTDYDWFRHRRTPIGPYDNPDIGCIILAEPFFFEQSEWIRCPSDFALNTVVGKGYDTELRNGRDLWQEVVARLDRHRARGSTTVRRSLPRSRAPVMARRIS